MLLQSVFEPFLAKRPLCVMARGVLENFLQPQQLDDLFEKTAERGYCRDLLFSSLVELMSDVILRVEPSVHAAYQRRQKQLQVTTTALYNKLNRVESVVSAELVRHSYRQGAAVIDALKARQEPWLRGYRCRVLDGNHLSATERRIEELRTTWAAPLPGKILVVLDPELMLARDVFLTEDGHAQERSLLNDVIATLQSRDLWIADRNFCTMKFLCGIAQKGGCFAIRQHGSMKGTLLGKSRRCGRTATGVVYEQAIRFEDAAGHTWTFRRITVELKNPTRDGDGEVHLLSNLPPQDANAQTISDLYRKRWTIETVFQEITATLECEIDTLGYPKAALFAFCLALLTYNAVSVLKGALRASHGSKKIEQVSGYYIALEIRQTYDGMVVVIDDENWRPFQQATAKEMAAWLKAIADGIDLLKYRKHPRGPKKKPPKKAKYKNGGHLSTAKLLLKRKQTC